VVITLVLAELALRLAGWATLTLRAHSAGAENPDPAAFRMLHIGESTTFGLGVPPSSAYPAVVAALLRERHPERAFQSFNRGVPGLVTASMRRTLADKLDRLRPALVTILAGANDYNDQLNGLENEDSALPAPLAALVHDLRIYKMARLAWDLSRPGVKLDHGEIISYRHGRSKNILYDEPRDEARIAAVTARLEANLEAMIAECRSHGAQVLLLGYIQAIDENRVLQRVAARTGVPYVATFIDRDARPADLFTADGWHPSETGHRHMAEELADAIEPLLRAGAAAAPR
jgi:lysophospholipase L1-like esterase